MSVWRGAAARGMAAAWELRRRWYALGGARPRRVPARVVSVGNLTVGGTGKTTLVRHLALAARARGRRVAVVVRDYRPGPSGLGDEHLLHREALGAGAVFGGRSKLAGAGRAAAAGFELVLVDDGFSHWPLARDLDVVLLDAGDPWGGGAFLPLGRLREPLRALQRADVVVVTRLAPGDDGAEALERVRRHAPAALLAAGRHRVTGIRPLVGGDVPAKPARVRVVTATGNAEAVARSAREAGLEVAALSAYRDHHAFRDAEIERERGAAGGQGAALLTTAKDAVRWPERLRPGAWLLEVAWEWVRGGEAVERRVFDGEGG